MKNSQYCIKKGLSLMRKKYCVGFFLGIFLCMSMIGIGIQVGYQYFEDHMIIPPAEFGDKKESLLLTEGKALKNEGFYLREEAGFLVVYFSDNHKVYEYTNIEVQELPKQLQTEILDGMYVETLEELYGILENYSS
jgi:hypothetical protein